MFQKVLSTCKHYVKKSTNGGTNLFTSSKHLDFLTEFGFGFSAIIFYVNVPKKRKQRT